MDTVTQADRAGETAQLADAYAASSLRKVSVGSQHRCSGAPSCGCATLQTHTTLPTHLQDNEEHLANLLAANRDCAASGMRASPSSLFSKLQSTNKIKQVQQPSSEDLESGSGSDDVSPSAVKHQQSTLDQELATRTATSTPWWWALLTLLKVCVRRSGKPHYCTASRKAHA